MNQLDLSAMRKAAWIWLCLAVAGCSVEMAGGASGAIDNEGQDRRTKVEVAFVEEGVVAVERYKKMWSERSSKKNSSKGDAIEMLAIAGLLLAQDKDGYGDYYRYISDSLKSNDTEIFASALAALSDAHGAESIDVLVDAASDNRPRVAAEALAALEYRLRTSRPDPALASDFTLITLRSKRLCGQVRSSDLTRSYCERNFEGLSGTPKVPH
ncbi:hypothetical protein [Lysobacter sp. Root983]|uniref:hypothetical protein n=1 Tax=Lysobacter sp. Root983 TaxID=1736613 RepID=UPI000B0BBD6E|nr:hypothetical protein [Lysobacter sp. Root983]